MDEPLGASYRPYYRRVFRDKEGFIDDIFRHTGTFWSYLICRRLPTLSMDIGDM